MENSEIKTKVELSAVITRADGTIEDLGIISEKLIDSNEATWFYAPISTTTGEVYQGRSIDTIEEDEPGDLI